MNEKDKNITEGDGLSIEESKKRFSLVVRTLRILLISCKEGPEGAREASRELSQSLEGLLFSALAPMMSGKVSLDKKSLLH